MNQTGLRLALLAEEYKANGSDFCAHVVDGEVIRASLAAARAQDHDDFRRVQMAWLSEHLSPLEYILRNTFETAIPHHGIMTAEAVMAGAMLGAAIIQELVDAGDLTVEESLANIHRRRLVELGLYYDGVELDETVSTMLFGPEAAEALHEIRNPVSLAMCASTLVVVMTPDFVPVEVAPAEE
jgi:hypothetical protein